MHARDETIRKHDERMANDEVLGPRKTMFVLVIVVGCFAVLWPRILSPLLAGGREQLKPNQFDRDAGNRGIYNSSSMSIPLDERPEAPLPHTTRTNLIIRCSVIHQVVLNN